jgi:membrane protease YdiL (CAAX protease family)
VNLSQHYKSIVLTLVFFAAYLLLKEYFSQIKTWLDGFTQNGLVSYILTYLLIGIPVYIGSYLINPGISILKNLGLGHQPIRPLAIALLFSLPMFLGGLIFFKFKQDISIPNLIAGTIVAGFVEELFFRGFLFGQLFKYTRLGFISSIIIGAVIFAAGHLHQSQDPNELAGIFMVTFMGAVFFAWLYVEWDYNLWVPVFLHTFMNLAWAVFDMDDTALGGVFPNVFRALTIALAIIFTIRYKKKHNKALVITRQTLITKRLQ